MALPASTFDGIRKSLAEKRYAPVYLLHGEEGYFIDELVKDFENILSEDEKIFNQHILFGPQVEMSKVIEIAKGIPMMSDRQVVILKEAQAVRADQLNKLHTYVANPSPTTIFVICCRGAQAKGKDLMAALKKTGAVMFEAKKVKDYNAAPYISAFIKEKGLSADQKALQMLVDFVGADLSRVYNEVNKLATLLPPGGCVTPEVVERNIGVSRQYNTYEYVNAIAAGDAARSFRIIAYFRSNPKAVPTPLLTAALFNFFSDLLQAYYAVDRSDGGLMHELGVNSYALRNIKSGMSHYNPFQIIEILGAIRTFDTQSKGVGSRQNEHDLLRELTYHILSAPGRV